MPSNLAELVFRGRQRMPNGSPGSPFGIVSEH